MASLSKLMSAARVSGRNIALGGSVASLTLLREPRKMFSHATELLFLYKAMGNRRGIPQKFVFEVLPCDRMYELAIANFQSEEGWMMRDTPRRLCQ
jgi:hypothetical protein